MMKKKKDNDNIIVVEIVDFVFDNIDLVKWYLNFDSYDMIVVVM